MQIQELTQTIMKWVEQYAETRERELMKELADRLVVREPAKNGVKRASKPAKLAKPAAAKSNGAGCPMKLPSGAICGSKTHGPSRHNTAMTMAARFKKKTPKGARAAHA